MSSEKSYLLDDESEELGSDSGSSVMYSFCSFILRDEESVAVDFSPEVVESF